MGKIDGVWFLFDEKIYFGTSSDIIDFSYNINDRHYFLSFSPKTKEFVERHGFGGNGKVLISGWWKNPRWNWKEMGK